MRKCYVVLSMAVLLCAMLVVNAQAITRLGSTFDAEDGSGHFNVSGTATHNAFGGGPAIGDWVSFDITVPADDIYTVTVVMDNGDGNRAAIRAMVDGVQIGWVDTRLEPFGANLTVQLGGIGLAAGPHTFTLQVITSPSGVPWPFLVLRELWVTGGGTQITRWGGAAYDTAHVHVGNAGISSANYFAGGPAIGDWMQYNVTIPHGSAGIYTVELSLDNGDGNRGNVEVTMNGVQIGVVDIPASPFGSPLVVNLGDVTLRPGTYTFNLEVIPGGGATPYMFVQGIKLSLAESYGVDAIYGLLDSDADGNLSDETVGMTAAQETKLNNADLDINETDGILDRLDDIEDWIDAATQDADVIENREMIDSIMRALTKPGASGISGQGSIKD